MTAVTATYRLQLRREFPLSAARERLPYLQRLGISHLYLSPLLAARPGSPHGYDVIDHGRLNPELGTPDDLQALSDAVHRRGMGIILDIVPNHMAVSEANRQWDDVLERGRASRFADWFDIEWDARPGRQRGRIVLPVLGDEIERVLERGELKPRVRDSGARLEYQGRTFPLDPATLPKELQLAQLDPAGRPAVDDWAGGPDGSARLQALLDRQHYVLAFWRAARDINYRRFFDVNDLVAVRAEVDAVFDATHALVLDWIRTGIVDGLRVDHIDGLAQPAVYLEKLRGAVDAARPQRPRVPIFVEKILTGDETLPREWPVEGTTGYDFMNAVEELFIDPQGFAQVEANYRGLRHNPALSFRAIARDGKRRALLGSLCPDVERVTRVAHQWRPAVAARELQAAIVTLLVELDVYRTYVDEPGVVSDQDRAMLERAFASARESTDVTASALDVLRDALFAPPATDAARSELVVRLQQLAAPAMAKGVEDTALYVYIPLASRNEVGGDPQRSLADAHDRMHAANATRAREWPRAMLATNTHDTKRSADLRARLDTLASEPDVWARHVARWRRLNKPRKRIARGKPAPDTNSEYLFYQMLFGLWPAQRPERRADDLPDRDWIDRVRDRLAGYMLKAAREAKTRTSWTDADTQYEKALESFVRESMDAGPEAHFLPDVARLTAQKAAAGFQIALARLLIHCTAPGVPDVYQGDEIWNFALVDPDNRRPVDYAFLDRLHAELGNDEWLADAMRPPNAWDGRVKMALMTRLLNFRKQHPGVFLQGDYLPLHMNGFFAYARRAEDGACICVARTRFPDAGTGDRTQQQVALPDELAGQWRSALTGRTIELARAGGHLSANAGDLIARDLSCELLFRTQG